MIDKVMYTESALRYYTEGTFFMYDVGGAFWCATR